VRPLAACFFWTYGSSQHVCGRKDSVSSLTWRMPVDFKSTLQRVDCAGEKREFGKPIQRLRSSSGAGRLDCKNARAGFVLDSWPILISANLGFEFESRAPLTARARKKKRCALLNLQWCLSNENGPMTPTSSPTPRDSTGHFASGINPISPGDEEHLLRQAVKLILASKSMDGTNLPRTQHMGAA